MSADLPGWQQEILDGLRKRDQEQLQCGSYNTLDFNDYSKVEYLYGLIDNCVARTEALKSDNVVKKLDLALNEIETLKRRLAGNERSIQEKDDVNSDLIIAFGKAKKDKESIREMYGKLHKQHAQLQEEMAMTKKTIEIANDHILELQLENNMIQLQKK